MVSEDKKLDWNKLRKVTHSAVHFLDNVIDVNKYPLPQIDKQTKDNRKIGLGVMGFADLLFTLGVPYNSEEAVKTAEKIMSFIQKEARIASAELAKTRGPFTNFKGSAFDKPGEPPQRNATVTTIAPTGTLSIIAGCSSGIEPLFAIVFVRNVMDNTELLEVHPIFEAIAKDRGFYSVELMRKIAKTGSITGLEEVPEDLRHVFVTAHNITPKWHIKLQAAFQKYTDNAVSKTINFSHSATPEDVEEVYRFAYKLGCKGVTVYRDGSRENQVLSIQSKDKGKASNPEDPSIEDTPGVELTAEPLPTPVPSAEEVSVASAKIEAEKEEQVVATDSSKEVALSSNSSGLGVASIRDGGDFKTASSEESGGCPKCEIPKKE
jgi:ribonucleoside-diphosphate reductase alpha chain